MLRGSLLGLNLNKGHVWPLIFYMEISLIVIPVVLLSIYGVSFFEGILFNVKQDDVFGINLIVLYSLLLFVLFLSIFLKIFKIKLTDNSGISKYIEFRDFANASLVSGLIVIVISYLFFSYKHAFFQAVFFNDLLIGVRLENKYLSTLPSQFGYIMTVVFIICSIYSGFCFASNKYFSFLIHFLGSLFLASAAGDKAPVVMVFIYSILAYYSCVGFRLNFNKSFFIVSAMVFFYVFIFYIVSLQIENIQISDFNIFLLERLGVGQMTGVYETMSIKRLEGDFYLHSIPFSRLFSDYVPYDKALMMYTEGYEFDAMGVKNTLFISEAFGIGGWILLLLSPLIVAFSYALGFYIFQKFISMTFSDEIAFLYSLPLYIIAMPLTGGFSSYPFFKGLILNIFMLSLIFPLYKIIKLIGRPCKTPATHMNSGDLG